MLKSLSSVPSKDENGDEKCNQAHSHVHGQAPHHFPRIDVANNTILCTLLRLGLELRLGRGNRVAIRKHKPLAYSTLDAAALHIVDAPVDHRVSFNGAISANIKIAGDRRVSSDSPTTAKTERPVDLGISLHDKSPF